MRDLRGTYVHRGDQARRRRSTHRLLLATAFIVAVAGLLKGRKTDTADAKPTVQGRSDATGFFGSRGEVRRLQTALDNAHGELDLLRTQYERTNRILDLSTRFNVTAGMATRIFDEAARAGVDPELAFRLVRLESDFNPRATSSSGAVGLTQLMPATAQRIEKGITHDALFEQATNLRIGFHYLHNLLEMYDGSVRLALLAYNRGEDAVSRDLKLGIDPGNGYDVWVANGYRGPGRIY